MSSFTVHLTITQLEYESINIWLTSYPVCEAFTSRWFWVITDDSRN